MATYGVQAHAWLPVEGGLGSIRLTRRGRLVRSWALVASAAPLVLAGAQALGHGQELRSATEGTATAVPAVAAEVVVEQGDSLWGIVVERGSDRDPREGVVRLREFNGLSSNVIHPGQVIRVPSGM